MLTSRQIDKLSIVDQPYGSGLTGSYKRQKRWHEFIKPAVMEFRNYLESHPEALPDDDDFHSYALRVDDFLYQLEFNDETFVISPSLELAYVLRCREEVQDITSDLREIQNHTDGYKEVGFSLADIENEIIKDLQAQNKKDCPESEILLGPLL